MMTDCYVQQGFLLCCAILFILLKEVVERQIDFSISKQVTEYYLRLPNENHFLSSDSEMNDNQVILLSNLK